MYQAIIAHSIWLTVKPPTHTKLQKNLEVTNFDHISDNGSRAKLKISKINATIVNFWTSWYSPC